MLPAVAGMLGRVPEACGITGPIVTPRRKCLGSNSASRIASFLVDHFIGYCFLLSGSDPLFFVYSLISTLLATVVSRLRIWLTEAWDIVLVIT